MKHLAIWGYYGFGNVGDEALLSVLVKHLQTEKLSIFSGEIKPQLDHKNYTLGSRRPGNLINITKESDAFILGPGGLLHERKNVKGTWYHLAGPFFAQYFKKPYCAVGQQIGSFTRNTTKYLVRRALKKARFLAVRDEKSFDEAANINLNPTLSADLAFLIKPDEPSKEIYEKIKALPRPRFIFSPATSENYTPDIKKISMFLKSVLEKTGGSLIMIPFFARKDDAIISEISNEIDSKNVLTLQGPVSWQDAFGIYRMADFSIPMRLHSMIASALSGVPALPIVYHEKVRAIGADLGLKHYVQSLDDGLKVFGEFFENADEVKKTMNKQTANLKARAGISVDLLRRFVDEVY